MTYEKPKVLAAISAARVIEHSAQDKGLGVSFDVPQQQYIDTLNAYEADE